MILDIHSNFEIIQRNVYVIFKFGKSLNIKITIIIILFLFQDDHLCFILL